MHFYPHHIGDFLKDAGHLSNEQMGVYLKLIWRYYLNEKPLEDDCEMLAFLTSSDEKTVSLLLRNFFKLTEEGWQHTRCDKVINDYHKKSKKAAESANARWNNANAMRTHTERNANEPKNDANHKPITNNQEPITNNQEPIKKNNNPHNPPLPVAASKASDAAFLSWYEKYPHKVGRAAAARAFKAAFNKASLLELEAGLERYVKTKPPTTPWCNPATWLNQQRWLDQPAGIRDGPKPGVHVVPASERANSPEAIRTAALIPDFDPMAIDDTDDGDRW
jgi:uncharacterized protein YdaU (DUF1376 family)